MPGNVPNRFLMWGRWNVPFKNIKVLPIVEYRNGFPYTVFDAQQNYVGVPNAHLFPNFFSADARVMRDFKVKKYTLRLSLSGFNITNHFNALAVHDNIDDPLRRLFRQLPAPLPSRFRRPLLTNMLAGGADFRSALAMSLPTVQS